MSFMCSRCSSTLTAGLLSCSVIWTHFGRYVCSHLLLSQLYEGVIRHNNTPELFSIIFRLEYACWTGCETDYTVTDITDIYPPTVINRQLVHSYVPVSPLMSTPPVATTLSSVPHLTLHLLPLFTTVPVGDLYRSLPVFPSAAQYALQRVTSVFLF